MAGMNVHVKTTGAVAVALFAVAMWVGLAGRPPEVGWALLGAAAVNFIHAAVAFWDQRRHACTRKHSVPVDERERTAGD